MLIKTYIWETTVTTTLLNRTSCLLLTLCGGLRCWWAYLLSEVTAVAHHAGARRAFHSRVQLLLFSGKWTLVSRWLILPFHSSVWCDKKECYHNLKTTRIIRMMLFEEPGESPLSFKKPLKVPKSRYTFISISLHSETCPPVLTGSLRWVISNRK